MGSNYTSMIEHYIQVNIPITVLSAIVDITQLVINYPRKLLLKSHVLELYGYLL